MKKHKIYLLAAIGLFSSCNDDFLNRYPESSLVTENFFNTPADLALFVNKLYLSLPTKNYQDLDTDNAASSSDPSELSNLLHGSISSTTVEGWDWAQIRELNYFLENCGKAQGDQALINHYIGIVRMLRAEEYYTMIKRYHEVPWYSRSLNDDDKELLYKPRDSRDLVMDSIMADLQFAVANVSSEIGNRSTFSKGYAYGMMARIALHEGTYRKYHDELNLESSAEKYLKIAETACKELMSQGLYRLYDTGNPASDYGNLFKTINLQSNPEIILMKDYDDALQVRHSISKEVLNYISNLSRSLMESYEVLKDGKASPFSDLPDYDKTTYMATFQDRDPRYRQTFVYPGFIRPGDTKPYMPNLNLGGYPQLKFVSDDPVQLEWWRGYSDVPIMRYAEILLMYAEAKAEQGILTQTDLDNSINLIRKRAGMPSLKLSELPDDRALNAIYPNVTDKVILQVRRERRVELACEGFRKDDIMRWKVGERFLGQQGIYVPGLGVWDITGDGVEDIGIYRNSKDVPPKYKKKVLYYLEEDGKPTTIALSDNDKGHLIFTSDISSPKTFISPKYYYYPLPQKQLQLNELLGETIFWGETEK